MGNKRIDEGTIEDQKYSKEQENVSSKNDKAINKDRLVNVSVGSLGVGDEEGLMQYDGRMDRHIINHQEIDVRL